MDLKPATLMAFLHWWLRQLTELLPASLVRASRQRPDALVIELDDQGAILWHRQAGAMAKVVRTAADGAGMQAVAQAIAGIPEAPHLLLFRIPQSMQLRKLSSFPLAARRDLANVLGFEMDRETPFGRGEVYWDYVVRRQDAATGKLDVELFIVPRPFVDPVIESARRAGLHPTAIELDAGEGEVRLIRVGTSRRWKWLQSQRPLVGLATAIAGLLLLAIITPFIRQQIELASADSTIEALTAEAREAATLRQSVDEAAQAMQLIRKQRDRNGTILEVLAATTRLLPDDSHLTALSLRDGRLTITGLSPGSAHIVDLLAGSPAFKEPTFDSPVVQDDASGLETFTISASLSADGLARQIAAPAPPPAPGSAGGVEPAPAQKPAVAPVAARPSVPRPGLPAAIEKPNEAAEPPDAGQSRGGDPDDQDSQ
jgi:general secretion pathway protein L